MSIEIHSDLATTLPDVEKLDDEGETPSRVETVVTVLLAVITVLLVSFVSVVTALV